jgi:hypothetical protein
VSLSVGSAVYLANDLSRASTSQRPDVAQILAHPSYPDTIWKLTPTQSEYLPVGEGRGGPLKIHYEVHGKGSIKLVVCAVSGQDYVALCHIIS